MFKRLHLGNCNSSVVYLYLRQFCRSVCSGNQKGVGGRTASFKKENIVIVKATQQFLCLLVVYHLTIVDDVITEALHHVNRKRVEHRISFQNK